MCPNCHTLIDKNPLQFPVDLLHDWKRQHEEVINRAFIVPVYEDRQSLAKSVHKLLRINRSIFWQYGPHSSMNPLSDAADIWKRHILADIIPNNRKITNLLSANEHLLYEEEKSVFDKFVLHHQALEYNHVSGDKMSAAPLFPEEMNNVLRG